MHERGPRYRPQLVTTIAPEVHEQLWRQVRSESVSASAIVEAALVRELRRRARAEAKRTI